MEIKMPHQTDSYQLLEKRFQAKTVRRNLLMNYRSPKCNRLPSQECLFLLKFSVNSIRKLCILPQCIIRLQSKLLPSELEWKSTLCSTLWTQKTRRPFLKLYLALRRPRVRSLFRKETMEITSTWSNLVLLHAQNIWIKMIKNQPS